MRFKPGDLAIVQRSKWAENNGKIALILAVDSTREAPYQIRRIDGQRWIADGHPHESPSIWAAPRYLRRLPLDVDLPHEMNRLREQRARRGVRGA